MFSEYASRFLAQSQSRLLGAPSDAPENQNRQPSDWTSRTGRNPGRSFLSRGGAGGNPYQPGGSRFGQLAFASRITAADDAPLFHHNGLPEFREEDDEDERDRDAADLYALQRSRRVAAASKLAESSETEPDASRDSLDRSTEGVPRPYQSRAYGRGIRSSWNGRHSIGRPGNGSNHDTDDADDNDAEGDHSKDDRAESRNSKGKMVDVGLNSEAGDEDPPESLLAETPLDNDPPAFQQFRSQSERKPFLQRRESIQESDVSGLPRESTDLTSENRQSQAGPVEGDIFKHDPFFAWLFLIMLAGLLSTTVLVWLNTSPPERGGRWGDTIYTTLHSSFHMLAVDTIISVMVSLFWLAALRSFVRPLVTVILVAVPVILTAFSLYPFISSFEGSTPRTRLQDRVLRWAAVAPAVAAIVWIYLVIQARRSIRQAVEILEFSSRILAANPALLLVGMASLVVIIAWTWLWLGMFTRVFLGGHFSKRLARFVISVSSWWLGVGFVLMYIWSLSVISAVQRATTGATVSQWYFHRNAKPAPTSREIVQAALAHATTTIFGTICESTFVSLLIRAPLLVLPSRLAILLARVVNSWIPSSVMALTNPLTVTYAAIHSQDLVGSARGLSQLEFISPDNPTTTLTPRVFKGRTGGNASPLLPYRLSKLLLMATRLIMATALGFAGWVITAKQLEVSLPDGVGIRGSAYAYVVGLVATFIGFSIMGAMEGILSGIVDAVVICYGSERRMAGGAGAYCLEAAYLFGDRRREVHGPDMA